MMVVFMGSGTWNRRAVSLCDPTALICEIPRVSGLHVGCWIGKASMISERHGSLEGWEGRGWTDIRNFYQLCKVTLVCMETDRNFSIFHTQTYLALLTIW